MKIVSFETAKALKEAGYPQLKADWSYGSNSGELVHFVDDADYVVSAPYAMEAWLWLWREKGICIEIKDNCYYVLSKVKNKRFHEDTPEEAIIAAVEYLIENDLIK